MTNKEFDSLSEKFNQGKCSEEEIILLRKLADDNFKFSDDSNFEHNDLHLHQQDIHELQKW
jgi:hypothetical protein